METYDSAWLAARVNATITKWNACAGGVDSPMPLYDRAEQRRREAAYDEALEGVEGEIAQPNRKSLTAEQMKKRLAGSFSRFAAHALDLEGPAIQLLTDEFLPIGIELGAQARRFDPTLSMPDIIQAARNAWTACGLQPLLGETVQLTPAIFAYSLMYPYSDNYLDDAAIDDAAKRSFSERFRQRLSGQAVDAWNEREQSLWKLIAIVEAQYPRAQYPRVFECLLAIHQAQEDSLTQLRPESTADPLSVLRLSCAKGGSSVLADACLARGALSAAESRFAFEWGVLLQLGDDLQDLRDDMHRGSRTLFSIAAASGESLDRLTVQLLRFSAAVGQTMDHLPYGDATLKNLLKMSWRSLIVRAVAESHEFFSPRFLRHAERCSPFCFPFLRKRSARLAGRRGVYADLFEQLTERPDCSINPAVHYQQTANRQAG